MLTALVMACVLGAAKSQPTTQPESRPAFVPTAEFYRQVERVDFKGSGGLTSYVTLRRWEREEPRREAWAKLFETRGRKFARQSEGLAERWDAAIARLAPPEKSVNWETDLEAFRSAILSRARARAG